MSLRLGGVPAQTQWTLLYSFKGDNDGEAPAAPLINVNGELYGTTSGGGPTPCAEGCGTVFKITTSGAESVLHRFRGGHVGAGPSGLTDVNGVLYGTTEGGGTCAERNCGTVFKITTSGTESILYNFAGGSDGIQPFAGLTNVDGVLYGTTTQGGSCSEYEDGCGTVFAITTAGVERVLYRFAGGSDGAMPESGLTNVNGVLYGTTIGGSFEGDKGTVFSITTAGTESVLHRFGGGYDGLYPMAGLTNVDGVLYGTTPKGGAYGGGTVYKITTSGTEQIIYSFAGGSYGANPTGLTSVNGVLYGATGTGGPHNYGTVFKMTTSGVKTTLVTFADKSDGVSPGAALTDFNGVLYGTTIGGGSQRKGTVFSLSL